MKDVIIALDFQTKKEVTDFLKPFKTPVFVKVGMELFYSEGPEIIKYLKTEGHRVFLDLKFHDIPNTVAGAVRSVSSLGVDIVNVHAAGGIKMMADAKAEIEKSGADTKLIAITQLTSTSSDVLKNEILIDRPLEETVLKYAENAKTAGLDGVVCSALEVPVIKKQLGDAFLTVTPGIRPSDSDMGDQKRVVTPFDARELGSDYIVVGRPITKAADPYKAYLDIKKDFTGEE